eukprot:SAG11_NODE_2649_length_3126_cov_9.746614_4_plen_95_part_00
MANLGSRLLDQQEANAELRAQVEALRAAVDGGGAGSGGSDAEYADADGLPGGESAAGVAEPAPAAVPDKRSGAAIQVEASERAYCTTGNRTRKF